MKRILAVTLTLVMLLAALAGCNASKKPSGKEGEQNPSGGHLPIILTIAETEPSCPAFESDCFYAFDTEGILYRVLWTDFEGLHEKDTVAVEYSKKEELNIPADLTGGFHAKYEITANNVKKDINPEDYLVSHIQIKSGANTIHPFGSLLWSETDHGDGFVDVMHADYVEITDMIKRCADVIPKLVLDESVSYLVQVNGRVENVYLLTPNGDTYAKSETTFDALSNLEDGTYYVAFEVLLSGNCDPDAPQNSSRYQDIFCLVVGEDYLVSHIQIKSGNNTIHPFGCMTWSKIDNDDGTFTESFVDKYDVIDLVSGKTPFAITDIPKLVLNDKVSYFVQVNGRVEKVYLLTPNDDTYTKSETTFDALSNLADGTYYVVLEVLLSGNCDPDAPQNSYRYEDVFRLVVGEEESSNDDLTHSGYEVEIKLFQYTWDGWGISTKTVGACDVAYNIIDALKAMKETRETVPKISDDVFEIGGGQYSAERGTMWIESAGKIYRLTPDLSQICLVETHFGEGKVLEITDEFKTNVNNAWHYAPYDYYKGTYNKGDYTVDLTSVFRSGSTVQLSIKKIQIESGYDPNNTITVELISSVDQEVNIKLHCQQSDDNLAAGDYRTVQLKKGEPTTVDLTFGGWPNFTYWVYIEADYTKAEITINP